MNLRVIFRQLFCCAFIANAGECIEWFCLLLCMEDTFLQSAISRIDALDKRYISPPNNGKVRIRIAHAVFVGAFVFLGNDIKHRNDTDDCQ